MMGVEMGRIEKIALILTIFALLFLLLYPAFAQNDRGIKIHSKRLALVIGNSAYKSSPLNNTVNDAEDMTTNLRKLGFKVMLEKNADQRRMDDAIRYFGKQLKDGGVGLFYFAGHGMQVNGRNYLIPINARIETESDVKYEAVDAGRVLGKMEDAGNQLNIVILDACRNNPLAKSFRSDQKGLARMDAPTGSLIAYSTAPGEVAADGSERNGIFTKYLIEHMMTPDLSIEHVLKRVRIDVAKQTNGRQIPWESTSLMGDFSFNSNKATMKTERGNKSKLPPENTPETQVAAIPVDNMRNIEPWTGRWNVSGYYAFAGTWILKQNGNTVVSTKDSDFEIKGKITGNYFKGRAGPSWHWLFELKMSSDGQMIEGTVTGLSATHRGPLKGSREE